MICFILCGLHFESKFTHSTFEIRFHVTFPWSQKKTELVKFAAETETPTEYITSIAGHGKNLYDSEGAGAIA